MTIQNFTDLKLLLNNNYNRYVIDNSFQHENKNTCTYTNIEYMTIFYIKYIICVLRKHSLK